MPIPELLSSDELGRARSRIIAAAEAAPTAQALFSSVSAGLAEFVPADASGWFGVDPTTLLPSWPARIENVEAGQCETYWRREFLEDDTLLVKDLAVGPRSTGAMQAELGGLMARSARYREYLEPNGFHDELRSAFRTGDSTWGVVVLLRRDDLPAFSPAEVHFFETLSQPLAEVMRQKLLVDGAGQRPDTGPGILTFDLDGVLLAANDDALHWLDQLPNSVITDEMPTALTTALAHARAVEHGRAHGTGEMLLPSRSGQWLRIRASALRGSTGEPRAFAVTIDPTTRRDLAPMLAEAYGLSRRELEVTLRLARGESTTAIADSLFLSEHTVRDHVKAVLMKTGVSSRAALVSHLFFEYSHAAGPEVVHL
ncbi:regulatory protein, luxR family [Rathayibacter oskolensis]|uniref:Regulatory protein, luxR family n=1 Tax=Rathayibacter oskolensis TaxID=1891671 RepID=A0A1X7NZ12_9MICO|nr:LuxR C-terminal-related transcriptional regulator [Rathayibacter oskolensis]SMH42814.1 regulatory protein, luxR family [Rathayibacter oskolensis]